MGGFNMKKLTALFLSALLCMSVLVFAGCTPAPEDKDNVDTDGTVNGGGNDNVDDDQDNPQQNNGDDEDKDAKKLIVGLDDSFPPLGFRDENNEIVGFDVDLARAVITKMGYEPVFQPIDWSNKIMELNNGNVDILWNGFTITEERKEQVLFTDPYLANAQVVVVKADSAYQTKADLEGKTVAAQVDSSGLEALLADDVLPGIIADQPVEYQDNVSALNDVKIGRVDAVVVDLVVADYYVSKDAESFRILEETLAPEEYGIGVKLGNETLRDEIQTALDAIVADGTAAEISAKWFGTDKILK